MLCQPPLEEQSIAIERADTNICIQGYFKNIYIKGSIWLFGCYEFQKSSMNYSVSGHMAYAEYYRMNITEGLST